MLCAAGFSGKAIPLHGNSGTGGVKMAQERRLKLPRRSAIDTHVHYNRLHACSTQSVCSPRRRGVSPRCCGSEVSSFSISGGTPLLLPLRDISNHRYLLRIGITPYPCSHKPPKYGEVLQRRLSTRGEKSICVYRHNRKSSNGLRHATTLSEGWIFSEALQNARCKSPLDGPILANAGTLRSRP